MVTDEVIESAVSGERPQRERVGYMADLIPAALRGGEAAQAAHEPAQGSPTCAPRSQCPKQTVSVRPRGQMSLGNKTSSRLYWCTFWHL